MENEKSPLTVGINQKMSVGELLLFAVQHLMGITFLLAVPGIIGAACGLTSADIGYMVQSCFITAGLVTILQSIFILKLPAVHGPTAVFMSAILTTGAAYGLGTAYGSTAVITIDMHEGHLSTDPDCPCPSPRGRQIIEPLNKFMEEARALNIPIIHVRSVLRKGGVDEKLNPSAWRLVFPITVGEIPNIAEHAIEGTKWNKFSIDVHDEDLIVSTKKRLSAFYPTDLEMLLRNMGIKRIVLTGCMTDCCVLNTAFDGANRDFRIVVPRDLTRGSEHLEEAALRIISLHLGLVVDSAELLEDWKDQTK